MASSSALIIPLSLFVIGTRLWALGKRHGFMTPVQMFRDRWECAHIGTVIFAVQAVLLVPYIVIAVIGGGTTLRAVSGGWVPFWLGGAVVSLVVMGYVLFGGMRGTAWVNTFQTILFLSFGAIAVVTIGHGMGGFRQAVESMLASPATAPLLTRERVSPWYFFSYTFIPLSSIAFPHIGIFCLTARRLAYFRKTVVLYPVCMLAIWLPSVFLGVVANRATDIPAVKAKVEARATLAAEGPTLSAERRDQLRAEASGDDVILKLVEGYAPLWLTALLGAAVMAAVMASDSQILALSTMFTEDVFAFYVSTTARATRCRCRPGAVRRAGDAGRVHRGAGRPAIDLRHRHAVRVCRLRGADAAAGGRAVLARQHPVGRACRQPSGPRWRCSRSPSCRPSCRRPRPGAAVSILTVAGIEVIARAAAGTTVLGLLPVVPMTLISALLMVVVSRVHRRITAGRGDAREVFLMDESASRLTPLQWLIAIIAAIGFAFDSYVLLVLPSSSARRSSS
jgi:Na+/pantothenate symporter